MVKRVVAACCWFVVITWAYNYLGYYFGLPFLVGPVVAAAVSAYVLVDPLRVVWQRTERKALPEQRARETRPAAVASIS